MYLHRVFTVTKRTSGIGIIGIAMNTFREAKSTTLLKLRHINTQYTKIRSTVTAISLSVLTQV
jgi:hypothetical protein